MVVEVSRQAETAPLSVSTVHEYLKRAEEIIRLADRYSHPRNGGRGGAGVADGRVPLPQHRIDSEELVGPAAPAGVASPAAGNAGTARHSWRGVLRVSH